MLFYRIARVAVTGFYKIVFLMKSIGKENVPSEGGVLLCSNHRSYFDPPAVAAACPRRISIMAKEELFHNPIFGRLIKALGAYPIRRGKGDAGAVLATIKLLGSGGTTLVFPEGTRVREAMSKKINPGIIRVAIKARSPIVPTYTNGKYRPLGRLKVYFGKPIYYDEYYDAAPDAETLERLAAELMESIYAFAEEKAA